MEINLNCVGCAQCAAFCKHDAIRVKGRAYIMGTCTECGICAAYCPVKAMEIPL